MANPWRKMEGSWLVLTCDPMLVNWGAPDERVTDRCSICERLFKDEDVPLMLWNAEGWAAALCDACVDKWVAKR